MHLIDYAQRAVTLVNTADPCLGRDPLTGAALAEHALGARTSAAGTAALQLGTCTTGRCRAVFLGTLTNRTRRYCFTALRRPRQRRGLPRPPQNRHHKQLTGPDGDS